MYVYIPIFCIEIYSLVEATTSSGDDDDPTQPSLRGRMSSLGTNPLDWVSLHV